MKRSSVCPSVCPSACLSHHLTAAAVGLLLSAVLVGDINRERRPPGAQQQRRRSTTGGFKGRGPCPPNLAQQVPGEAICPPP